MEKFKCSIFEVYITKRIAEKRIKMKDIKMIALGLLFTLLAHADSVTNNAKDVTIIVPGKQHNSTHRQLATMNVWTDINKYLPKRSPFRTFGTLINLCDYIVVADVLDISYASEESDGINTKRALVVFNLNVHEAIYGKLDKNNFVLKFNNYSKILPVKKGDKALLFLADYPWHKVDDFSASRWSFSHDSIVKQIESEIKLIYFYDGMINVADEKDREQIVNAVKGYLQILRNGNKNPSEYYLLLSKLLTSENQLIKENAIRDMFMFCKSYDKFDLQRAMNDPNLEEGMKRVIFYHSQPSRAEGLVEEELRRLSE